MTEMLISSSQLLTHHCVLPKVFVIGPVEQTSVGSMLVAEALGESTHARARNPATKCLFMRSPDIQTA